ncbi:MAG TPA: ATP-binding protein, partial [bacterium]|nr:ATP-binding protein [bacterium]
LSVVAQRSQKTIAVSFHPDSPKVKADSDLIGRVINNLVSNSVKHTPKGARIEVAVKPAALVPGAPTDCSLVIAVSDNGEGIPREYHEKIFEKFGTVEGRKTGAPKMSTGLGLTFCKMAVEAHGGRVWLESELGHGATFWVALPPQPPAS